MSTPHGVAALRQRVDHSQPFRACACGYLGVVYACARAREHTVDSNPAHCDSAVLCGRLSQLELRGRTPIERHFEPPCKHPPMHAGTRRMESLLEWSAVRECSATDRAATRCASAGWVGTVYCDRYLCPAGPAAEGIQQLCMHCIATSTVLPVAMHAAGEGTERHRPPLLLPSPPPPA